MTDPTAKLILEELREMARQVKEIHLTIHGDGDQRKGLVRRVDRLAFQTKLVFSSVALALAEHWFGK